MHSLGDMMYDGTWVKSIDIIATVINKGMCARDKIEGERYIQAFFKVQISKSRFKKTFRDHPKGSPQLRQKTVSPDRIRKSGNKRCFVFKE